MSSPLLEVKDLQVIVGEENKVLLDGLNLTVNAGETHVLMGHNGAGKSTLMSALMGDPRYTVTRGQIIFRGQDITHETADVRARAGMFCALCVVGSVFSFPMFGSKCAPVQHMVNVLCAVLLGPWWGVGVAFVASLLRNLLGLGSLMAFPGSMFGALLCGLAYHKTKNLIATVVGEVFGTSILGGLCAWPVAIFLMGKSAADIAFYAYIVPFLISTAVGAVIAGVLVYSLQRSGALRSMQNSLS